MKVLFAMIGAALLAGPAAAQESLVDRWNEDRTQVFDASEVDLDELRWIARPIIVFGESEFEPQFRRQLDLLISEADELATRDVILITDTDPDVRSDLRTRFRPRAFMLAIVGKDGQIKLRKPAPWDVREISRSIDKMPLRQQEIRDRRGVVTQ
ncbi:protein of unknown function [Cognatiyoonia sediminum]|uniref:DUF4174 domain-containing protein n=1 Tax=Cognatiyoonia sediminum TaxID=1508389 RepID=A0A1M5N7J6_9RHOB|nr:DUF4174 domain-containing protein [Cognatiyoonia sediminum]SHG85159.1 protein of unknown function [Cognatiyoonia sediminum]